ncbi:MAG: hypothetical protein FOGNACKC_02348 [Anaerolineae bacterium]|nr:hypothetical protein [Anaerolineae bacterium]
MVACAAVNTYRRWLIALILIAFGLRLYNLTYHSLWFDEAVSVYWARQSLPRILEVGFTLQEDRLPPLYYLTLKGWGALAGFGELAVRLPSVFYGVLLIPVLAGIGAMLFNRRVGLFAAALAAVNPFLVWYSQEARMYAPAVFFGALAVWALLKISESASQRTSEPARQPSPFILHPSALILFVAAMVAGLYSHLYAGFLLPALGLWLVIAYPWRWQLWLLFAAGGLLAALAYAPILLAIWRFSGESVPGSPLAGLPERVSWLLTAFTVWKAPLPGWLQTIVPLTVALFALLAFLPQPSAFKSPPPAARFPRLLVSLLLVMPFAIATGLLSRNHLAFFGERYFIVMVPWLLLLAAAGSERISESASQQVGAWLRNRRDFGHSSFVIRHWSFVIRHSLLVTPALRAGASVGHSSFAIRYSPFAILLILSALPLPGQWTPAAAKEAWRQSAAYLAQHATPADGILIHPDWVRYPFQFYFNGPGQTYAAFSTVTAATALDGPLQGVVDDHPVIWLIQSHLDAPDPERRVEQWFAARYPLVTELYPPGISLKGFAPGYQLTELPPPATPTDIQFANGLRLAGFQAEAAASATDDLFHPPSGWLHVILYWQATQPIADNAVPLVNLVGPEGVWGASLERPNDALDLYPTSRWAAGGPLVRQDVDVNLNPATPPGVYQLVVGLAGSNEQYSLGQVKIR